MALSDLNPSDTRGDYRKMRDLALCLAGNLWGNGEMAFFEPKMQIQLGIRFVKKC